MSDNEYGDGDGGEEYDVFANEDDDPQVDEPAPLDPDPADMEIIDAGEAGGAGRSADDRITTKYMTKYERARILGTRALQIRCATHAYVLMVEGRKLLFQTRYDTSPGGRMPLLTKVPDPERPCVDLVKVFTSRSRSKSP